MELRQIDFRLDRPIASAWLSHEDWWWALESERRRLREEALFGSENDPADVQARIQAEIALCKSDVVHWINNYGWMENPKATVPFLRDVPVVLWPKQEELIRFLLRQYETEQPALVCKGRELGASWLSVYLVYNFFREEYKFRAKFGSRKDDLVDGDEDSLFAKLRYMHSRQPWFLQPPVKSIAFQMTHNTSGAEIIGEATNAGFGRGGRRGIMVLDEFAHVNPPQLQSKIWNSIQTGARSPWFISTPQGPGNKFAELYSELPEDCVFTLDWTTDTRRDEEWRLRQIEILGEELFDQEHGAKIVTLRKGKVWTPQKRVVEFYDDTEEWVKRVKPMKRRLPLVGGWDFGSGASLLVCFFAHVEMVEGKAYIWVEDELVWKQTSWRTAAEDAKDKMREHGGETHYHFGDPAGRSPESDQSSWEGNLRMGGIPLMCLADHHNSRNGIEWGLKWVSELMAEGRLRVHRRCEYLWACIDNWRREIPEGIELGAISRSYIPPRHDEYSHGGMGLVYLVGGILTSLGIMIPGRAIDQEEAREKVQRKGISPEDSAPLLNRPERGVIEILPRSGGSDVWSRVSGSRPSFDEDWN